MTIYADNYCTSDNGMSQLVKKTENQADIESDTMQSIPLHNYTGKSPDFLELLMRYQTLTHNRIGDINRIVRNAQYGNTMIPQERFPYDS